MYKKCVIVGAYPDVDLSDIDSRLIVCADGGMKTLNEHGIKPHIFIGDRDSFKCPIDKAIKRIILPKKKDYTDLHYAIKYALKQSVKDIVLTGCTNGRADHYLANVFLLEYIEKNKAHGVILDSRNRIELYNRNHYNIADYKYVSVIPLTKSCTGVTLTGLKYPLVNARLARDATIGISNESVNHEFKIEISKGKALIIMSRDDNDEVC